MYEVNPCFRLFLTISRLARAELTPEKYPGLELLKYVQGFAFTGYGESGKTLANCKLWQIM